MMSSRHEDSGEVRIDISGARNLDNLVFNESSHESIEI
jgi:hypothetical protein